MAKLRGLARQFVLAGALSAPLAIACSPAQAQPSAGQDSAGPGTSLDERLSRLEALALSQARRIAEQDGLLSEQRALIERQAGEIGSLRAETDERLNALRGRGLVDAQAPLQTAEQVRPAFPPVAASAEPVTVGEAPAAEPAAPVEVSSLPEGMAGVLTPPGRFTVEPSIDYVHASGNRLVFRGVEIVTGFQVGVIEASDADRDSGTASVSVRYGLTRRLELEARVPYVARNDRVTTIAQQDESITRTQELDGSALGDVELAARYQLNSGANGAPVFVGNLRVKSDTGTSAFEVDRDEFGVATELPTGSGFWGVEPSVSVLYPSDPAVLFASLGYLYNIPKDIDRQIGSVLVGEVDPGDTISAGAGFGFALNPRFSFSLGYRHSYIFPTDTEFAGVRQSSEDLQVGAFTFGWSFQLTERLTLSNGYEFGATSDAPDVRIVFRLPYRF